MHVERLSNWSELVAIQAEWNSLAGKAPFRSWDWLGTWWKHYGGEDSSGHTRDVSQQRQLYVLALYDDSEIGSGTTRRLVGIAPWYIDRSAMKGNVIRWLGDGEVCTDHLSLICREQNTAQVSAAIADALTNSFDDWDRLELCGVDSSDTLIESLMASLGERGNIVSREAAEQCWVLELPASWDDYLASISKSHRKQLRQLERRVLESDRIVWHRVETSSDLDVAWPVLVDLHQRRRRSLGEPGCFASQEFHDFHREVAARMLDRGQLRISWLELDGTPAAAEYHFADTSATYAYQGGVDPDRLEEEAGRLSTILCLKQAIEEKHSRLDFLRGDEPYKAHWRAAPHATLNYYAIPNRRLARLRGQVWNVADTLGDWARQGAHLVGIAGSN